MFINNAPRTQSPQNKPQASFGSGFFIQNNMLKDVSPNARDAFLRISKVLPQTARHILNHNHLDDLRKLPPEMHAEFTKNGPLSKNMTAIATATRQKATLWKSDNPASLERAPKKNDHVELHRTQKMSSAMEENFLRNYIANAEEKQKIIFISSNGDKAIFEDRSRTDGVIDTIELDTKTGTFIAASGSGKERIKFAKDKEENGVLTKNRILHVRFVKTLMRLKEASEPKKGLIKRFLSFIGF